MKSTFYLALLLLCSSQLYAQISVDLNRSVPLWLDYNTSTNQASLKWIGDGNVNAYQLSNITYFPTTTTPIGSTDGSSVEYPLGTLTPGVEYGYLVEKGSSGQGVITVGLQIPVVHQRGRCLIAIDDILTQPLAMEISQLINDIEMDGWEVETINIPRTTGVPAVKSMVVNWYDGTYEKSQALFILGHVAVPYSGNSAHDGHTNHSGAWAADLFYGEVDGVWTDETVNNTTPSRAANKNIPGDGKYDQTSIPSDIDIEVGRVDFHDLPAFSLSEIELTRQYLNKNHDFKIGNKEYPRRALVENNFGSFSEGFGQSGWRNYTTMFGGSNVSIQNYETVLENEKYLCSYACGGGSYVSCSGVGTTSNLWAAKNIQTVFTMTFGSYFGDWDSQNNFLRAALGSGDILTNAWAGRPVWQVYDMSLGKHIGFSTKATQNASSSIFNQGIGSRRAHIALMGDPTLRLHAMKKAGNLTAVFEAGNIDLNWEASLDAANGYVVYRKINNGPWEIIADSHSVNAFSDECVEANTSYEYMVKAIRLELTGSGTYYNTSLGATTTIAIMENPFEAVCNSTLPVSWASPITAKRQGKQTLVSWSVTDQVNNDYFEVEHRTDGADFREIGTQSGAGNFAGERTYDFTHDGPASGVNYYRIKQVDYDGDFSFSNIASVNFQSGEVSLYPNPTTGPVSVETLVAGRLSIYDFVGRLVKEVPLSAGTTEISLQGYPNGIYVFRMDSGEGWKVVKE